MTSWKQDISLEDLNNFYSMIVKLSRETFGTDDKNNSPVEIMVVDRTKFMAPPYICHIPNQANTVKELKVCEKSARTNMVAAIKQYELICGLLDEAEKLEQQENKQ